MTVAVAIILAILLLCFLRVSVDRQIHNQKERSHEGRRFRRMQAEAHANAKSMVRDLNEIGWGDDANAARDKRELNAHFNQQGDSNG